MTRLSIDAADAVELAEMCEFVDGWLAADAAARAGYDHHVGAADTAEDLRTALQHFAALLQVAPPTPEQAQQ